MNRSLLLVAIPVVLVIGGCSGDDSSAGASPSRDVAPLPSESAGQVPTRPPIIEGEELPIRIDSPEPLADTEIHTDNIDDFIPPADENASLTEEILQELRRATLMEADAPGDVGPGECEGGDVAPEAGDTTVCTITYEGVEVHYLVEISTRGFLTTSYTYSTIDIFLWADSVYNAFWESFHDQADELRCDDIPELSVFAVNNVEVTPYTCQILDYGGEARWQNMKISIDSWGQPHFFEPE
jgi:hypothetical protein